MQQQVQTQYDNKSQYERVLPHRLEGEQVFYVFDLKGMGSGFIGITDRRLIFIDQNFLDRKDTSVVSIPYSRVTYVGFQAEHKFIGRDTSAVTVVVPGRSFDFAFHGLEKAHRVYHIINHHICK